MELVQTAQATTSQAASSTRNQEPAGGELSSAQRTQGGGHDTPDSDSGDAQGGDDKGGDNEVPQHIVIHWVLQEEVEAMAEKGDRKMAS